MLPESVPHPDPKKRDVVLVQRVTQIWRTAFYEGGDISKTQAKYRASDALKELKRPGILRPLTPTELKQIGFVKKGVGKVYELRKSLNSWNRRMS